jgi:hypothetical protein
MRSSVNNSALLSRRSLLGLLVSGGYISWLGSIWPRHSPVEQQPGIPATNINDALKHERGKNSMPGKFPGKVVSSRNTAVLAGGKPDEPLLDRTVGQSLMTLTGASTVDAAWSAFLTPDDIVGLKVNPVAGKLLSTSPEIVRVIIRQLEHAGIPRKNIVLWDRREFELHDVGFTPENFPGIRITGTEKKDSVGSFYDSNGKLYSEAMIDREWYYWADVEEKYDAEMFPYMINEGKYSYFSTICTKDLTKIINIPILKNAGSSVTLCLKNLAFGSVSNTSRLHKQLWHQTCAEVPAFAPLRDKVVLNIVDGVKGCYQGGPGANPEFIIPFNTILVGTDPVAVDRVGYEIIFRKRLEEKIQKEENPKARTFLEMADKLGLGTSELAKIDVIHV